jgi:hypothetical protein
MRIPIPINKTIVTLSLILVSTVVAMPQSQSRLATGYTLSVDVHSNKESFTTYAVFWVSGRKKTKLSKSYVERYIMVFFNTPKDVLWLGCADGYRLNGSSSRTGSQLMWLDEADKEHWPAGVLFDGHFSGEVFNLTITCSK